MKSERVVVLGASPKPDRYSNQAVRLLIEHGHTVIPVHPVADSVHGIPCVKSLEEIRGEIDTLSLYLGAERSTALTEEIIRCDPTRVIFNPGTENQALEDAARQAGCRVQKACTLVMLKTGQWETNENEG